MPDNSNSNSNTVKELSLAEQDEIKHELEEFEDEFDDAVQTEGELKDGDGNFGVSKEELSILRADLACEFPEDFEYLRYVWTYGMVWVPLFGFCLVYKSCQT